MRRKQWPNTIHWQRIEVALRVMYGTSWRRRGEDLFGHDRGELRIALDRRLSAADIAAVDERLLEGLREHEAETRDKAAVAARAVRELEDFCAYRRRGYMDTPRERLIRKMLEDGTITETEAA